MFRTPVGEAGLQLCQMVWEGLSNEMGIVKSMHVEMEPRIIRVSRDLSGKVPAVVLGIKLEQDILDGTVPPFAPNITLSNTDMGVGMKISSYLTMFICKALCPNYIMQIDGHQFLNTPKRPLNAFMLFARQRRSKIGRRIADSSKILAKEWREMGNEEEKKIPHSSSIVERIFSQRLPDLKYTRKMKPRKHKAEKYDKKTADFYFKVQAGVKPYAEPKSQRVAQELMSTHRDIHYSGQGLPSKSKGCGLWLEDYQGSFKYRFENPYPYEENTCLWQVDERWQQFRKRRRSSWQYS
ncbi:hypothetical protein B0H14DRAFT_3668210 [Mycena olivaceomarginata]|nr:hypothetical protein B0H14DRAFT_3668210 [Mycena olivaceomarginata]